MTEEVVCLLLIALGIYVGYRCGVDDTKSKYEGKSLPLIKGNKWKDENGNKRSD